VTEGVLQTDIYTDFQGLNALRGRVRTGGDSEETLREVAGQFEALFIQMMLKSMRDASLGEGMLDTEHTKTYQAMFDKQISIDMSQGQGIGLAEMMVQQLREQRGEDLPVKTDVPMMVPSRQEFSALRSVQLHLKPLSTIASLVTGRRLHRKNLFVNYGHTQNAPLTNWARGLKYFLPRQRWKPDGGST